MSAAPQRDARERLAEAEARAALALAPTDLDALHFLASLLLRQGRAAEALAPLRRAVELEPDEPRWRCALSAALRDCNWPDEALLHAERAYALAPAQPLVRIALARALRLAGDLPRAIALLEQALDGAPSAQLAATLAQLRWEAGAMDAAVAAADAALALDPQLHAARVTRVNARRVTAADDADLVALEAAADAALPAAERVRCLEAVGKCREDLGDHAAAFARHAAAKALRRDLAPRYDHAQTLRYEAVCRELVADGTFRRLAEHGSRDARPVFVVGMPRSGTSLVEQVVAAHPAVHGCGELLDIGNLARRLHDAALAAGRDGYPVALRSLPDAAVATLAQQHLDALVARAGAGPRRIVDKMPMNLRHLGLVHALFPQARILLCRREPRDNCLSVFFQGFGRGHEYAYDLGDLGRYWAASARLAALWRELLPGAVHEVAYEDLVAAPEAESRKLIAALGLEWDDRCLRPQDLARPVRTASAWQVRQPIHQGSVGRWRRHADALAPLVAALRAEGVELAP